MKSRIEESLETISILEPFTRWDAVPLSDKARVAMQIGAASRSGKLQEAAKYLAENLHPSDPRYPAAQRLLNTLDKVPKV